MKKLEYSCGLGSVRPAWMQRFANTKCFMVVYSLLGTVQGMSYIYMSTTLTTLEKRFKIPSQTIGILMSGNEVSQVFLSLAMSYHGGRGNRPLWISWGVTFSAISCFILALPHLVYGPGKDAIALTEEFLDTTVLNSSIPKTNDRALLCSGNRTASAYCQEDVSGGEHSLMPLILIFFSQFVLGIGTTLFHSLGQTYLDDHTKKTNAPLLLGMVLSLRMLGPAAGFAFSSFCLSLYIDPTLTPVIKPTDPRWLGAWWLGWLVLGALMIVFAFLISWFPRELPPKKKKRSLNKIEKNKDTLIKTSNKTSNNKLSSESEPLNKGAVTESLNKIPIKIKKQEDDEGFMDSLKGLLQNKLLIYNIFAGVFYVMGEAGTMTFSMKYMEIQYHTSAAGASMISGSASVFAMIFGFLGSGYFIGRFKPRPRLVLGWNVILGAVHVIGSIIYIYLGCQDKGVYGLDPVTGKLDVGNSCNMGCECDDLKYQPVCYREKDITFYSACHIGCNDTIHSKNGSTTSFTNCTCLPFTQDTTLLSGLSSSLATEHPLYAKDLSAVMTNGPCPVDCTRILYTYILVGFFIQALSSSGRIGNVLVNFRCVKQKDKVFAQGLSLLLVSLFAFIPGPILFGAMIENTFTEKKVNIVDESNWRSNIDFPSTSKISEPARSGRFFNPFLKLGLINSFLAGSLLGSTIASGGGTLTANNVYNPYGGSLNSAFTWSFGNGGIYPPISVAPQLPVYPQSGIQGPVGLVYPQGPGLPQQTFIPQQSFLPQQPFLPAGTFLPSGQFVPSAQLPFQAPLSPVSKQK